MYRKPSAWPVRARTRALSLQAVKSEKFRYLECRIPPKHKGLIYKSIIRPVLLYGSESWLVLSRHTQELHVTEMKMLRWICGVTRSDRIRNTSIRDRLRVRDVADNIAPRALREMVWPCCVLEQGLCRTEVPSYDCPWTQTSRTPKEALVGCRDAV